MALLLPLVWPFAANLLAIALPKLMNPIAFVSYTFVPMMNSNWDTSLTTIVTGLLLYLLRNRRGLQVGVFSLTTFLYFFVVVGKILSGQPDFAWSQMFTQYYEWMGMFAGLLMLCYNGQRGRGLQKPVLCLLPGPYLSAVCPFLGSAALDELRCMNHGPYSGAG